MSQFSIMGISIAAIVISVISVIIATTTISDIDEIDTQSSQIREIHLFTEVDENIDEDKFGVPPDLFSLDSIVVNKGDTVKVHFYNLEPVETQEHHTFTIEEYGVDADINAGQSTVIEFTASDVGVYEYICTFHQPTMTGQLIVLDA